MKEALGLKTMPETAENLATKFSISRQDQDRFSLWSQEKTAAAQADGRLGEEIIPVTIPRRKGDPVIVTRDEHPRSTSLEKLSQLLEPIFARKEQSRPETLPASTTAPPRCSSRPKPLSAIMV